MLKQRFEKEWNWLTISKVDDMKALQILLFFIYVVTVDASGDSEALPDAVKKPSIKHVTVDDYLRREKASGHKANRLIDESSPYLLQHAYNPVHWYSWGEDAFEKAKKENKPIFLSVGYSPCVGAVQATGAWCAAR